MSAEWIPPEGIDPECIPLCRAINAIPGLHTVESCCGHGADPFRIWLRADRVEDLLWLCYAVDG